MSEVLAQLEKKGGGSNQKPLLNMTFDYYTNGAVYPIINCSGYNAISITRSGGSNTRIEYPKGTLLATVSGTSNFDCTNYDCLYLHPIDSGASTGKYTFTN